MNLFPELVHNIRTGMMYHITLLNQAFPFFAYVGVRNTCITLYITGVFPLKGFFPLKQTASCERSLLYIERS